MSKGGILVISLLSLAAGALGGWAAGEFAGSKGQGKTVVVQESTRSQPSSKSGWDAATTVYKKAAPGVVYIRAGQASGSGFVISKTGDILSNAHVVGSSKTVQVTFAEGGQAIGKVIAADRSLDVALVRVTGQSNLKPLPLGNPSTAQVGQPVMAIGNPFGLEETLTVGVISALNRSIRGLNGFTIPEAIQTDAAINPGNSGGPLLDAQGKVLGINTQIVTSESGGGSVGIGFAVPIDAVSKQLASLQKGRGDQHGWLGVEASTLTPAQAKALGVKAGALVSRVTAGSPAAKAGIKPGDIFLAIDNKPLATGDDFSVIMNALPPGKKVQFMLRNGKQQRSITVILGNRPAQAPGTVAQP